MFGFVKNLFVKKEVAAPKVENLASLLPAAVVFGAAIITLTVVADVVTQQAGTFTAGSAADNVSINGLQGLTNMSAQLPTLGTILIALVILGALASVIAFFAFRR